MRDAGRDCVMRSVLGAGCPVLGGRCSVVGARWSVVGVGAVVGARWSVVGGRCSVVGVRCSGSRHLQAEGFPPAIPHETPAGFLPGMNPDAALQQGRCPDRAADGFGLPDRSQSRRQCRTRLQACSRARSILRDREAMIDFEFADAAAGQPRFRGPSREIPFLRRGPTIHPVPRMSPSGLAAWWPGRGVRCQSRFLKVNCQQIRQPLWMRSCHSTCHDFELSIEVVKARPGRIIAQGFVQGQVSLPGDPTDNEAFLRVGPVSRGQAGAARRARASPLAG